MKKFLAVFDGYKMSGGTLEYAIQLTIAANAHLVGVFLDEFGYLNYDVVRLIKMSKDFEKVKKMLDAKDKKKRDDAVRRFELACGKAGVRYSIHRDRNVAIHELKHESMFADLAIINEHETFTKYPEKSPTRFMRELLADLQCPVLVVPNTFRQISGIMLLYDGGPSSLYAIKMFSYLFGNLHGLPVEVYSVKDSTANLRLPDNKLMRDFIKRHFPGARFTIEKGRAEQKIPAHLKSTGREDLVVLGAYRRGELSRIFRKSMADLLMKGLDRPLFVAHHR